VKERDRRHVKYNGVVKELKAVKSFHFIHHSSQEIELLYRRNIFEEKIEDIKLLASLFWLFWDLFWAVLQLAMFTS